MSSATINAVLCLVCRILLLFLYFLWTSTQDSVSHWFALPPRFQTHFLVLPIASCTGAIEIWVYIKRGLEMKKDGV